MIKMADVDFSAYNREELIILCTKMAEAIDTQKETIRILTDVVDETTQSLHDGNRVMREIHEVFSVITKL